MVNISVEWKNLEPMQIMLKNAPPKLRKQLQQVIQNNTEKLRAKNVERAPKPGGSPYGNNPYATGFTASMITSQYPSALMGKVVSQSGHSGYLNYGTRFMAAQPFFTDSYNFVKPLFEKDAKDAMKGAFK